MIFSSFKTSLFCLFVVFLIRSTDARGRSKFPKPIFRNSGNPTSANCTEKFFDQRIDHFTSAIPPNGQMTYKQRYFMYDQYWGGPGYPIFFYTGNEADVTLYVNNTGLMWETAPKFQALIIFAEHRYYGSSRVFGDDDMSYPQYLSSEQALADYAVLITGLKKNLQTEHSAVIAFGGSYGGMLSTWFRYKYPHIVDGAIAASAPIWDFLGEHPAPNGQGFFEVVTNDASSLCQKNVRATWDVIFQMMNTNDFNTLTEAFSLCSPLETTDDVWKLLYWLEDAWSTMAEGNYPYPSSYLLMGDGELPAWPVSVACTHMEDVSQEIVHTDSNLELLNAMKNAVAIFYNNSGSVECFDIFTNVNNETSLDDYLWNNQYCSEIFMICCGTNGVTDMFWEEPFNVEEGIKSCQESLGVTPREYWFTVNFGGRNIKSASNIVFSNGNMDPWSAYGVKENLTDSLVAVIIEDGAHHLDLMFSNPNDPQSVIEARELEIASIQKWIEEKEESNKINSK